MVDICFRKLLCMCVWGGGVLCEKNDWPKIEQIFFALRLALGLKFRYEYNEIANNIYICRYIDFSIPTLEINATLPYRSEYTKDY